MYYFHTRVSMIENSVSKQNQVLADFFSTFQNDLRSNANNIILGQDIHSNENGSSGEKKDVVLKNNKIEVSDDEDGDSDDSLYSGSDSESELDLESDTESDKETNTSLKTVDESRRKLNRNNEMAVNAIEELVEEIEKEKSSNDKLDIKEIYLSSSSHGGNMNDLSSLILMIKDNDEVKKSSNTKTCTIEDVTDTTFVTNNTADDEVLSLTTDDDLIKSAMSSVSEESSTTESTPLKKMKITKLSASSSSSGIASTEKETVKKEGVAELRNKAVLMGLVTREESAKLKKNELLELLKSSDTIPK